MALLDDFLAIDTPENVVFGYEVVGIGSRFLAALIDTTLIVLSQLLVNGVLLLIIANFYDFMSGELNWVIALIGLISFFFLWGYYILFEMIWNGQSPGKRFVGLRVIRTDGTPITLVESIIRNLVRIIDFLPAFYGVGVFTMFINSQARRLGDLAANTLVVREQTLVTLEDLATKERPLTPILTSNYLEEMIAQWPIKTLTDNDIQMAESYLNRRVNFVDQTRIARQIVIALMTQMNLPERNLDSAKAAQILTIVVKLYRQPVAP